MCGQVDHHSDIANAGWKRSLATRLDLEDPADFAGGEVPLETAASSAPSRWLRTRGWWRPIAPRPMRATRVTRCRRPFGRRRRSCRDLRLTATGAPAAKAPGPPQPPPRAG